MRADKLLKIFKKVGRGEFKELSYRLFEEWRRLQERRIHCRRESTFSDEYYRRFVTSNRKLDFVTALKSHTDSEFMPGFFARDKFGEFVGANSTTERNRIVAAADQVCNNLFPVFNVGFVSYGDPPRWDYDPILGVVAPDCFYADIEYLDPEVVGDSKVIWELSRLQFVYDLGQAYLLTKDEKYSRKFFELLLDWRTANRDYHGINFCSALESAFRLHSLLWGAWFFKDSRLLTEECARGLYDLVYSGADFVRSHLSYYFSPNTHLLGEAYSLFMVGLLFPEFDDADVWVQTGHDVLLMELGRQYTADGMHAELSTAYHGYAVEFLLSLLTVCRQRQITLEASFGERLRQATEILASLQRPDGTWPHIGDEDGGRLFFLSRVPACDFRPLLEACGKFLGQTQDGATDGYTDAFWFCGDRKANRRPVAIAQSIGLCDSGLIISRSENGMYSVFQCGKFGYLDSPHSHADMLHLDISVGVDNFLVDPGTFAYTSDPQKRNLYRSAAAHNGPTIAGLSLEKPCDPFGWSQKPDCQMQVCHRTSSSGFYEAFYKIKIDRRIVTISRAVLFLHDMLWIIRDTVSATTPVQPEWNFVTPCDVSRSGNSLLLNGKLGRLALIPCVSGVTPADIRVQPFGISNDYLSSYPGRRITISPPPAEISMRIYMAVPCHADRSLPDKIDVIESCGNATAKLTLNGLETFIASGSVKHGSITSDADFTFLQQDKGRLHRAVIVGGSVVSHESTEIFRAKKPVVFADIINDRGGVHVNCVGKCDLMTPSPTERN